MRVPSPTLAHWITRLVYGGLLALSVAVIGVTALFYYLAPSVPQLPDNLNDLFGQPTEVYGLDPTRKEILIDTLGGRERVPLDQISEVFRHAVLAIEDDQFYAHHGVDKFGMVRAVFTNIRRGRLSEGASTITQQLARNLFFTLEKRWKRKLREMMAAMQIETRFTKDQILEAYCNNVYFGADAYGIESAARRFFNKHANDLTLGEAALLAGLPQSPSRYNPYHNMARALERRRLVLTRMTELHYITLSQAEQALSESVELKGSSIGSVKGPFFIDYVRDVLVEKYGTELVYYGGLKVYTTMDIQLQEIADRVVKEELAILDKKIKDTPYDAATLEQKRQALQAAIVSIDIETGAVRAIVGGRDYANSEFNRAIQSNRHPGSGFKPIIYLAAVDKLGLSPNTVVVDEPVTFGEWTPQNFSREFEGAMILKRAMARSINVISAKLTDQLSPRTVVEYARKLGITSKLEAYMSLSLGTSGISPLELASAYSVFPAGGTYHRPFVVSRVEDAQGQVLEQTFVQSRRAVSAQSAYLVLDMMRGVVDRGTGAPLRSQYDFRGPCGGKTGTSSDSKDVWFTGYTPTLSTAVWVGYDDAHPLKRLMGHEATGGAGAIPIWAGFMKEAEKALAARSTATRPKRDFSVPLGIEFLTVDSQTGEPTTSTERASTWTVALRGATPKPR